MIKQKILNWGLMPVFMFIRKVKAPLSGMN